MDGHLEVAFQELRDQSQGDGQEALHVRRAAPMQAAVALHYLEGIALPVLPRHRDGVGVARQHDAAGDAGADGGDQIGFGAFGVVEELGLDPMAGEIVGTEADELQVRAQRGGVEGDQPVHHLGRRVGGAGHAPPQPRQKERVKRTITVNSSSRPSSMPADNSHLAASGNGWKDPAGPTMGPSAGPTLEMAVAALDTALR